jgi:hypothetical protein
MNGKINSILKCTCFTNAFFAILPRVPVCPTGGRVRVKPFCHNVHMSEVAMLSYRVLMVLVQYLTPLCIISCVYARMALRLWGSRAPGNAQDSRDANLMKNKKKVSQNSSYNEAIFLGMQISNDNYSIT